MNGQKGYLHDRTTKDMNRVSFRGWKNP